MGLFDNVLGGLFGNNQGGNSSMSPLVKALLALLAAKAASSYFSGRSDAQTAPQPAPGAPGNDGTMTSGMLKGLPGLDSILNTLRGAGHSDAVDSWIGHDQNKQIPPNQLLDALGPDTVGQLEKESGLPRDQLASQLSSALPQVVDKLTPDGHLPPPDARGHW